MVLMLLSRVEVVGQMFCQSNVSIEWAVSLSFEYVFWIILKVDVFWATSKSSCCFHLF